MRRLAVVVAVLPVSLVLGTAGSSAAATPRPVVLVPLGDVGAQAVSRAVRVLRKEMGLRVRVARSLAIPASVRDPNRNQLVANRLLDELRRSIPEAGDGQSAVIAITEQDMYPANSGWKWAFAYRGGTVGVISLARMNDTLFDLESNPALLARRMEKYFTRYAAMLALGRAETSDPRSLLYDSIVSVDDLDFMEPGLPTPPLTAARRQWLRTTEVGCHAAGQAWESVWTALDVASADQVPDLLRRWADADAALAARIRPAGAGAPTARAIVLVTVLRRRAAFLRSLEGVALPFDAAQLKHLRSLGATIRSSMFEIGSKTCASETA